MFIYPEGVAVKLNEQIGRFTIVQVVDEEGKKAVGVARCSFLDQPQRDKGMHIAAGRACAALKKKQGKELIHNRYMG